MRVARLRPMPSLAQAALVGLALTVASPPLRAAELQPGRPAPDFAATDSNGVEHKLSAYRGKTVVLEWTNHDCPYVRKHYNSATMQNLQKDMAKDGEVWLSVISSPQGEQGHVDAARAKELTVQRNAAPAGILLDPNSRMARAYGAQTTPHMYIIDPKGTLAYMGAIDDKPTTRRDDVKTAKNYVLAAMDELKAGKPVTTSRTTAYGCTVKYAY